MKICKDHWEMMRNAIEDRGMSGLVARDSETAFDNIKEELSGGRPDFDPLMSMHWHWTNEAIRCGGLYLMGEDETGANDGQFCPVCEFEKNAEGFDAKISIGIVADQMAEYARSEGLIPKVS